MDGVVSEAEVSVADMLYANDDLTALWRAKIASAGCGQSHPNKHGWLLDHGVDAALAPFVDQAYGGAFRLERGPDASELRFSGLDGPVAAALLAVLPEFALDGAADGRPTIGAVLRAIAEHPADLRAGGRLADPGSCAEGFHVDSVCVDLPERLPSFEPHPDWTEADWDEFYAVGGTNRDIDEVCLYLVHAGIDVGPSGFDHPDELNASDGPGHWYEVLWKDQVA